MVYSCSTLRGGKGYSIVKKLSCNLVAIFAAAKAAKEAMPSTLWVYQENTDAYTGGPLICGAEENDHGQ